MDYQAGSGGRVETEVSEAGSFWTYDAVQDRLVETVGAWRRMPGGGLWPFAGDGPWHLVQAELYGPDVDKDAPLRPLPLRRAEIRDMNEATEWLTWVPEEKRRVLVLGLIQLANGRARISWLQMLPRLGLTIGAGGVEWRYSKAIELIANVLNARARIPYAPNGVRVRYPKAVLELVERLEMAENLPANASSPRMDRR